MWTVDFIFIERVSTQKILDASRQDFSKAMELEPWLLIFKQTYNLWMF